MKLWLLRHGEAHLVAPSDALRELTDRGCVEVAAAANTVRNLSIDTVLISPYVRAQQTAELVLRGYSGSPQRVTVPWLTPDTPVAQTLKALDGYSGNVLVVAHQPLLGDLAGLLLNGHRQTPLAFRTAQLLGLEGEDWIPGLMSVVNLHS